MSKNVDYSKGGVCGIGDVWLTNGNPQNCQ